MKDLDIPRLAHFGVSPRYVASGASRSGVSYPAWLEMERKRALVEGRSFRSPPVDSRGVPRDIAHTANPDEIMALAASFARGGDEGERGRVALRALRSALQTRDTDPVLNGAVPTIHDFLVEFPVVVDPTEILALCEEVGLYNALPEVINGSQTETWREMGMLEFASGCDSCAFTPGACPEDFVHDTTTSTTVRRHIGVKKTLTESDIVASAYSISNGLGVKTLVGAFNDQGLPGELDLATLLRSNINDLREKELRLGMILVLNCWDDLLVNGWNIGNPLEFDGLRNLITAARGARSCPAWMTGTFSAAAFDQFLGAGCALPQAIIGHPTALAQISLGYWGLGGETVVFNSNDGIVPGLHFASQVMAGIGPIALIGDTRFPRQDNGNGTFTTDVYPVRLIHNGEPLIYKSTQIPLSAKDLTPGCTAVSFEVWAVTALTVKALCAQAVCRLTLSGMLQDGCTYVHPCTPLNYLRQ